MLQVPILADLEEPGSRDPRSRIRNDYPVVDLRPKKVKEKGDQGQAAAEDNGYDLFESSPRHVALKGWVDVFLCHTFF